MVDILAHLMRTKHTRVAAIAALALVAACKQTSSAPPGSAPDANGAASAASIPFTVLHNNSNSGFATAVELVIQDQDELVRRWRGVQQGAPDTPMPTVNFGTSSIILVATGSRNTGGHTIHIDSIASAAGVATVHYTVSSPGSRCMSLQMLTAPVEVVGVSRIAGTVRFKKRNTTGSC